jgi:hypothetical protein
LNPSGGIPPFPLSIKVLYSVSCFISVASDSSSEGVFYSLSHIYLELQNYT